MTTSSTTRTASLRLPYDHENDSWSKVFFFFFFLSPNPTGGDIKAAKKEELRGECALSQAEAGTIECVTLSFFFCF